jgi:hypothetical protein
VIRLKVKGKTDMATERDDLAKASRPFFQTYQDFHFFKRITTGDRRYFRSEQSEHFLRAILDGCANRILNMEKGNVLFRAQLGHDWRGGDLGDQIPCPYKAERMKPLGDRAHEGRVNPKGIPCLYLASTREAAISERRPGISDLLSVARFETVRDLKIMNFNKKHGALVGLFPPPEGTNIDDTVWATIDKAFAEPIIRVEDRADYAATQIIAELLRINGFHGIAYRSQFDPEGFNVALFDLDDAQKSATCGGSRKLKLNTMGLGTDISASCNRRVSRDCDLVNAMLIASRSILGKASQVIQRRAAAVGVDSTFGPRVWPGEQGSDPAAPVPNRNRQRPPRVIPDGAKHLAERSRTSIAVTLIGKRNQLRFPRRNLRRNLGFNRSYALYGDGDPWLKIVQNALRRYRIRRSLYQPITKPLNSIHHRGYSLAVAERSRDGRLAEKFRCIFANEKQRHRPAVEFSCVRKASAEHA